jgi:serine/threonine protein phosphatase 1
VVYAVGDVHGCYRELYTLERKIIEDAAALPGRKLMIMLGDYIDRGPDSANVLEHLAAPPPAGFERICLAGNHETALLDYLEGRLARDLWLASGGEPTLRSYGIDISRIGSLYGSAQIDDVVRAGIPAEHVEFLRGLPIMVHAPGIVFVHAGIRPGVPLEEQDENDLLFIRSEFFERANQLDTFVVHGHTPVPIPQKAGRRLNIDTGAYRSGRLTAIRIGVAGGRLLTS